MNRTYTCDKLIKACYTGDVKKVRELVNDYNSNGPDKAGYTPIQIAAMGFNSIENHYKYAIISMMLMKHGANPFKSAHPFLTPAVEIAPPLKKYLSEFRRIKTLRDSGIINDEVKSMDITLSSYLPTSGSYLKSFANSVDLAKYWNDTFQVQR